METCPTCRGRGELPPERICANANCGRAFRFQEGRATTPRWRFDSLYCSQKCAKATAARMRRARVRARGL